MTDRFFTHPILNSPYGLPARHWELDEHGSPTTHVTESRRRASFITPIPKAKKQKKGQKELVFDEGKGSLHRIPGVPRPLDHQRSAGSGGPLAPDQGPEPLARDPQTARLLQHWRHHQFSSFRPFFPPDRGGGNRHLARASGSLNWQGGGNGSSNYLEGANRQANPELLRPSRSSWPLARARPLSWRCSSPGRR